MIKQPEENRLKLESDWGVVQCLEVEADTYASLLAAMTIAHTAHSQITYYAERPDVADYSNADYIGHGKFYLALLWHGDGQPGTHPLAFPLTTPEEMARFVAEWLKKKAQYLNEHIPDTDGSVNKGFRVTHAYHYDVVRVAPCYIIYGK